MTSTPNPPAAELRAEHLLDKFGFDDGGALLDLTAALPETLTETVEHPTVDAHDLLIFAVEQLLLPTLDVPVVTARRDGAHNPIRAIWVGRHYTGDDSGGDAVRRLLNTSVTVGVDELRPLYIHLALLGLPEPPKQAAPDLGNVIVDGLNALIGRHVEVQLSSGPETCRVGTLLARTDDGLVLTPSYASGCLTVVPWASVISVETYDLSPAERDLLDAGDEGRWPAEGASCARRQS